MNTETLFKYKIVIDSGWKIFKYKKQYHIRVKLIENKIYWAIYYDLYKIKKGINNSVDYHISYYIKLGILECIRQRIGK